MDPFIGTIIMFAGNFAPRGWAFCDGQLVAINSNQALFSILGTTYGGDGRTTFGLPDLRGRVPIHAGQGQGPGLSSYPLGAKGGQEQVVLQPNQMPASGYFIGVSDGSSQPYSATNQFFATTTDNKLYNASPGSPTNNAGALGNGGNEQGHENRQPYGSVNFIIALEGLFPSRS